jgi:hypothetical protein
VPNGSRAERVACRTDALLGTEGSDGSRTAGEEGQALRNIIDMVRSGAEGGLLQATIAAAVIVLATFIISRVATGLIRRILSSDGVPLPSSSILVNIARAAIWVVGLSTVLSACFGIDVNGLIAALGVGGIALSLGLQDTIKNFIGGLQVTLMKIVQPGDHIMVGGTDGIVQDVSWRQTVVKDYENNVHLIPNAVISSTEVIKVDPSFIVTSTVVLNNDGTCIAHPEGRGLLIKDKQVINDLKQRRKGMVEMTVSGKPVTVFYGPVTDHNWCVAVVVPAEDTPQPVILAGLMLLVVAVLGMIVIYKLVKI